MDEPGIEPGPSSLLPLTSTDLPADNVVVIRLTKWFAGLAICLTPKKLFPFARALREFVWAPVFVPIDCVTQQALRHVYPQLDIIQKLG